MATAATNPKQEAHELIDSLAPGQVAAVVGLLKIMLDPVSVALANAPYDDEPVSAEEARASLARAEVVSNEEVLAEFGLTAEDLERIGRTPLEPEARHPAP